MPAVSSALDTAPAATLTETLVDWARQRIDQRLWRPGARIPSIRETASSQGVSRFTVVAAYARLERLGLLEARPGSGYFVRASERAEAPRRPDDAAIGQSIDVHWLVRNMIEHDAPERAPGLGVLPDDWLPGELYAASVRAVGRQSARLLTGRGTSQGYRPLREALQWQLAEVGIAAPAENIVMTSGVTHALDLVTRAFVRPGDTVFVEDPAWFLMFARFAVAGARVVGVPRGVDGPDVEALDRLAEAHAPKLFVASSVCHNPTGSVLSAACAHAVLRVAERRGFRIVDDDVYGGFAPVHGRVARFAALGGLANVIHCGGFSKTLAPNVRVGYAAASPEVVDKLVEHKMLGAMSTPELDERIVFKVMSDPRWPRHLVHTRERLAAQRERAIRLLEKAGWRIDPPPESGMFVWADAGRDTQPIAADARRAGLVAAPGALFSPAPGVSTRMRFNVITSVAPETQRFLARALR